MTKYFLKTYSALLLIFLLLPNIAHANGLQGVIADIGGIIAAIIPILVALALLFFFWGLAIFILNAGNEQRRTEGRGIMIWGIIALFVMLSVWGLVVLLQTTFGVGGVILPPLPQVPGPPAGSINI